MVGGSDGAKIMGVPIGEEAFVRSYSDQKIRQLKKEYAAIAELRSPAMEIQLVRATMAYTATTCCAHARGQHSPTSFGDTTTCR
jgi:hypothetical protein